MILDKIIDYKKTVINQIKERYSISSMEKKAKELSMLSQKTVSFYDALKKPGLSLIAEVKKASPSKGILRQDFDPIVLASFFEKNNASAISVLTEDKFFLGNNQYLTDIKKTANIPLLRKDFIIDEVQILESKIIGSDAILLIASLLSKSQLEEYFHLAHELKMDVLCEIHDNQDLEKTLGTSNNIIGINNRNLNTFHTDIMQTIRLRNDIPPRTITVSESGIHTLNHLQTLMQAGIDAVLIGEGLAVNEALIDFWL